MLMLQQVCSLTPAPLSDTIVWLTLYITCAIKFESLSLKMRILFQSQRLHTGGRAQTAKTVTVDPNQCVFTLSAQVSHFYSPCLSDSDS